LNKNPNFTRVIIQNNFACQTILDHHIDAKHIISWPNSNVLSLEKKLLDLVDVIAFSPKYLASNMKENIIGKLLP
jgi:hypothetical protein